MQPSPTSFTPVFDVFNPGFSISELPSYQSHAQWSHNLLYSSNQTLNSSVSPHHNSTMNSNVTLLLFLTSFSATVEVVIACSIGAIMVFAGILTPERVQFLSQLIFNVFSPTFNMHALSRAISIDSIYSLWMLPILSFINTILGNIVGRIVFFKKFWRGSLSDEQQQVQFVTQTFNNGVTIPLVFMSAICKITAGTLFDIQEDEAVQSAMAFINVYTLPSIFLFWSYGVVALTPPKEDEKPKLESKISTPIDDGEEEHHLASIEEDHDEDQPTELKDLDESLHSVDIETPKENEQPLNTSNESSQPTTFKQKLLKIWNGEKSKRLKFILKQTINGPVIALCLGTIIGLIPPVKKFLITDPPMVISAFVHTLSLFASGIFPISMIILGANVAMTIQVSFKAGNQSDSGLSRSEKLKKFLNPFYTLSWIRRTFINFNNPLALFISIIIKLGVMPLLGVGIVYLGTNVLQIIPPNPIMILTILVEWSVPMAMATTTLSSINKDYGQRQICELLLFNYILAPITLSLYCWWFLNLCCQFTTCIQ